MGGKKKKSGGLSFVNLSEWGWGMGGAHLRVYWKKSRYSDRMIDVTGERKRRLFSGEFLGELAGGK